MILSQCQVLVRKWHIAAIVQIVFECVAFKQKWDIVEHLGRGYIAHVCHRLKHSESWVEFLIPGSAKLRLFLECLHDTVDTERSLIVLLVLLALCDAWGGLR